MKTTPVLLAMALLVVASSIARASDESSQSKNVKKEAMAAAPAKVEKQKAAKTDKKEYVTTGSYIKQPVRRHGMITDGSSQVLVVDRSNIERSGASTVSQILNRYGAR